MWKIWYVDNTSIEGTSEAEWNSAPDTGVLIVACRYGHDEHGRTLAALFYSSDWYWMYEGNIYQNAESTWTPNYWVDNPAPLGSVSKKGKWTTDAHMMQVENDAIEWAK